MWSLPIGSVGGIAVRVSIIYLVWMAIELAGAHAWTYKLSYVASLFVLVLLHEFGHCLACRWVGGEANDILMWMLGGLAFCRPPHTWRANLATTLGGPMVNVVLVPVFIGVMLALGAPLRAMFFNPWGDGAGTAWSLAVGSMHAPDWVKTPLFTLHLTNTALLLFNVLLPMFPMDGGRLLQNLMWRKMGYGRSMWVATTIGMFAAVVVGLAGMAMGTDGFTLVGLAIMGGLTCYNQKQQLRFMGEGDVAAERWAQFGGDGESWKLGSAKADKNAGKADQKRADKAAKAAAAERQRMISETAELDRILAKIKDKGMASLTRGEEAFLRRSTQKSRGGE
jgi:Zn-dependent protease